MSTAYTRENVMQIVTSHSEDVIRYNEMTADEAEKHVSLFKQVTAEVEKLDSLTFEQLVELVVKHAGINSEQVTKYIDLERSGVNPFIQMLEEGLVWLEPTIGLLVVTEAKKTNRYKCWDRLNYGCIPFYEVTSGYFLLKLK